MRIYYYHTRPILPALEEWRKHKHPGHILYGLTHFERHGIDVVIHRYKAFGQRWLLMLYNLWAVLTCRKHYDVLYATSYRGLELIIFLRALGLYRHPIALWHHQAITPSQNPLLNALSHLFYKGIDCMFFFSQALIRDSLATGKARPERLHLIHWGADLEFYEYLHSHSSLHRDPGLRFISTGKEERDFGTLLQAFDNTPYTLDIYYPSTNGDCNYQEFFRHYQHTGHHNIILHQVGGIIPLELAIEVLHSRAVVISCQPKPYTVGLTTLVEAMALGKPIICTRNPKFEIPLEAEGAAIMVDYGDVEGWKRAIEYVATHFKEVYQMGQQALQLTRNQYNLENYTRELSEVLHTLK